MKKKANVHTVEHSRTMNEINVMSLFISLSCDLQRVVKSFVIFTPRTDEQMVDAVALWLADKEKSNERFGHISLWKTTYITDYGYE